MVVGTEAVSQCLPSIADLCPCPRTLLVLPKCPCTLLVFHAKFPWHFGKKGLECTTHKPISIPSHVAGTVG